MKTRKRNRLMALALCLCMALGTLPFSGMAFAAEQGCNHVHNADDCGYVEAVAGAPCNHVHNEACGGLTQDSLEQGGAPFNSSNVGLSTVAGQTVTTGSEAGTAIVPKTARIHVDNRVASISTDDIVTTHIGATATLYSDADFMVAKIVPLAVGTDNHLYIKVVSEDGLTSLYYDVTVEVAAAENLNVRDAMKQFTTLTPGDTYWFNLSGENIPGTKNGGNNFGAVTIPDTTLHWVPFTYAGTINAYVLNGNSSGVQTASKTAATTTDKSGQYGYTYDHSLFIADYTVTNDVSWDTLNTSGLIFGKTYNSGGVDYTLRAPSVGSDAFHPNEEDRLNMRGTPENNEWDTLLSYDNSRGYIKNWKGMYSWGQDTVSSSYYSDASYRMGRGRMAAGRADGESSVAASVVAGFRPILEIQNPDTLGSDGLKIITLNLNGGKAGTTATAQVGSVKIVVMSGEGFTAPSKDSLTQPTGGGSNYFKWVDQNGNRYNPGDTVPADVTTLTAEWEVVPVMTKDILGVTAPAYDALPVAAITETDEYTGTVRWNPSHSTFAANTEYTATIILTPKIGYTLQGVGENFFTVTGATSVTNTENSGVITAVFPKTETAPTITGVKAMSVSYGYAATSSQTFTLTGNPSPIVTLDKDYDGKITWNDNTKKLNIAAGLGVGTYPITLTASNGIDPEATISFTLTVEGEAPMISGQTAMTLTHGYKTASTSTFTITGNPVPTVTKTSGDPAITWNDKEKKLEIAEELRVGVYPVTLTASNGVLPDATITFTLTVDGEASALTGPTSMTLIQGYPAASTGIFTITGNPVPSITIDNTYDGKITWNDADKKLEIAEGLAAGVYQVTLTADNGVLSDATITFTLTVLAPPTHEIIGGGDTEVKPGEDYSVTFQGDFKSWKAIRLNGVEMGIVPRSDTLSYLTYPDYTGNAGQGEAGSVKITLYKDFLETLSAGVYKLEVEFEDGGVQTAGEAEFKLLEELKPKPAPDTKPGTTKPANPSDVPPTGDSRQLWPWVLMMLAALISGSTVLIYKKKGRIQK